MFSRIRPLGCWWSYFVVLGKLQSWEMKSPGEQDADFLATLPCGMEISISSPSSPFSGSGCGVFWHPVTIPEHLFWDRVLVIPACVKTLIPASGIGAKDRLLWGVSLLCVVWAPLRQRLMQGAPGSLYWGMDKMSQDCPSWKAFIIYLLAIAISCYIILN